MKALILILQLIGLSLLGAGPIWLYDHHGPIGWHTKLAFWTVGFSLPDSLATQRDHARQALQTAQDATKACRGQLDSQNASIAALSAKSTAALAKSSADIAAAKPQSDRALKASRDLTAHVVVGAGELDKWRDADQAVVGSLKP